MLFKKNALKIALLSLTLCIQTSCPNNGKKSNSTSLAIQRLIDTKQALDLALLKIRYYRQEYPDEHSRQSSTLCAHLSDAFSCQAEFLQALNEAESEALYLQTVQSRPVSAKHLLRILTESKKQPLCDPFSLQKPLPASNKFFRAISAPGIGSSPEKNETAIPRQRTLSLPAMMSSGLLPTQSSPAAAPESPYAYTPAYTSSRDSNQ